MSMFAMLILPDVALACEKCFGAGVDNAITQGIGFAMLTLLVIVSTVFTGMGVFFVNVSKRSRRLAPGDTYISEEGELIDNHKTN